MSYRQHLKKIQDNIQQVMVGKTDVIELMMVSMLCSGHVLLEDMPGLGKTVMAKSLAKSVNGTFHRIQFTPDLLPSDVSGINFFNQKSGDFQFRKGPVFCHILLADEINRATPRTQSSLLEAMEEGQVTIDGETHLLEAPFMVIATQNPIESQGTFPLPEAQLDRFFMKIKMGYPDVSEEIEIMKRASMKPPIEALEAVADIEILREAQKAAKNVIVSEGVLAYIVEIVQLTRKHPHITVGASPRGSIALMKAARAYALLQGRDYVKPDDVRYLAPFVLGHRMVLDGAYMMTGEETGKFMASLLSDVAVPVENGGK